MGLFTKLVFAGVVILPGICFGELQHHWKFDSKNIKERSVTASTGQVGTLTQPPNLDEDGTLVFDGTQSFELKPKDAGFNYWLPEKAFTAEAWVKLDDTQDWGGIVGYQQDNGSYEKGWVLGYSGSQFFLKVSNGPKLHTISSEEPMRLGNWYHVAGTYDGETMSLFINGELVSSSKACSGEIEYPPSAPFAIGAYHDKDEFFPLKGQIKEVKLYDTPLSADQIAASASAEGGTDAVLTKKLDIAVPPSLLYTSSNSAVVNWEADQRGVGVVQLSKSGHEPIEFSSKPSEGKFSVNISGLLPQKEYEVRAGVMIDEEISWAPSFAIDTTFNYAAAALQNQNTSRIAQPVQDFLNSRDTANQRDGFCLALGLKDGALATAIAQHGPLRVIGISEDAQLINRLRKESYKNGDYGERLTFLHIANLSELPFTDGVANLVVSEAEKIPASEVLSTEIARVLRPSGGTAILGNPEWNKFWPKPLTSKTEDNFSVAIKPAAATDGSWTHQYGDGGNSSFAGEELGGIDSTENLEVQWIGRPGADFGIDRNPRMPAPLAVSGRLFHQGLNRIVALDAYHGTPLWTREIPNMRRVNIPRDCANWCADDRLLYTAVNDRVWAMEAANGELETSFKLPDEFEEEFEWGYIATDDECLYGSAVAEGSSYRAFWSKTNWYDKMNPESTAKVCSESLFAYSKNDQKLTWMRREGMIINPSISLHHGKLIFAECRNPALLELADSKAGRVGTDALWIDLHLVCLDASTGKLLWDRPLESTAGQVVFYSQAAEDKVLLTTSAQAKGGKGEYHLQTFSLTDGAQKWQQRLPWRASHHGAHMQHPVIVGGKVFLEPHGVDFYTGEIISTKVRPREGCSTAMASANAVFMRGTGRCLTVWSPETESPTHWPRLRPSCWLNMIAAQGLLLVPEGGAGCSCGGWMESSMAFKPIAPAKSPQPKAP